MWLIKCKEGHTEIVGTATSQREALNEAGRLNARYQTDAYYIEKFDRERWM